MKEIKALHQKQITAVSDNVHLLHAMRDALSELGYRVADNYNRRIAQEGTIKYISVGEAVKFHLSSISEETSFKLPSQWDQFIKAVEDAYKEEKAEDLRSKIQVGSWVTVLDTPNVKRYCGGSAVGYTFQMVYSNASESESVVEGIKKSHTSAFVCPTNKHRTNYRPSDIRLATPEEISKVAESVEYKVGDYVVVTSQSDAWGERTQSINTVGKVYKIHAISTGIVGRKYGTIYQMNALDRSWECPTTIRKATKAEIKTFEEVDVIEVDEYGMVASGDGKCVNFGCQQFTKAEVQAIARLFDLPKDTTLTIGHTEITKEMMDKILKNMKD